MVLAFVGVLGTLTKPDAAATAGILVADQERGGYDAESIIDDERRWRRAKGRLGTPIATYCDWGPLPSGCKTNRRLRRQNT